MKSYKKFITEYTRLKGAVVGGLIAGPGGAVAGAITGNSKSEEARKQRRIKNNKIAKIKHQIKRKLDKTTDPKKKAKLRQNRDKMVSRLEDKFKKKWGKHDYKK